MPKSLKVAVYSSSWKPTSELYWSHAVLPATSKSATHASTRLIYAGKM